MTRRSPRAFVNSFSYSLVGKSGAAASKARDHLLALVRVDEDVPEVLPAQLLIARVAARLERREIELEDPALRVHVREQAGSRVGQDTRQTDLGAELCLEPLVVEREDGRGGHGVDELRLVPECDVVEDRGDRLAAELDELERPRLVGLGLRHSVPLSIDPAVPAEAALRVEPVQHLQRRIAQRVGERLLDGRATLESHHDVRYRRPREARSQDAEEERQRHGRERREEQREEHVRRRFVDLVRDHDQPDREERRGAGREYRQQEPAQRRARAPPLAHEHDGSEYEQDQPAERREVLGEGRNPGSLGDENRAADLRRVRVGRRVEEELEQGCRRQEDSDRDRDETLEAGPEQAGRVREDERGERRPDEPLGHPADREHPVVLRDRETVQEQQVADCREVDTGPVLGPACEREEAAQDERHTDDDDEDDVDPALRALPGCRDQRDADGPDDDEQREPECDCEPAQARSARTASPVRSAFEMKPLAGLVSMSPS